MLTFAQAFALEERTTNPLLKCLGDEEHYLHKVKETGPIYGLNQKFISTFINATEIRLKPQFLKMICHNKRLSPSLGLMENILIRGEELFDKNIVRENAIQYGKNKKLEVIYQTKRFFLRYISELQGMSPNATCLESKIPEIKFFLNDFKELEALTDHSYLIKRDGLVAKILKKIKNFSNIYKECEKENKVKKKRPSSQSLGESRPLK